MPALQQIFVACTKLVTGANAVWLDGEPKTVSLRVYFANHGSHLDFATVYASLPPSLRSRTRPVAARDYWMRNWCTRFVSLHLSNSLLIAREGITRKDNPIAQMADAIKQGWSLILFPEGTRSTDGNIGPFKPGLYHLASKVPEAEFIPVYLQNLNRILPKGHLLPIPIASSVVFGSPIQLASGEKKPDFLHRAREAVVNLAPHAKG